MLETTITLASKYGVTPFDIFDRDTDDVIMLLNYYIKKGNSANNETKGKSASKDQRIRVNDKTATGGWW